MQKITMKSKYRYYLEINFVSLHRPKRCRTYILINEAFQALSFHENRQNFSLQDIAVKDVHACRISTPRQGASIFDKAWEWTVCRRQGVWRCPVKIN